MERVWQLRNELDLFLADVDSENELLLDILRDRHSMIDMAFLVDLPGRSHEYAQCSHYRAVITYSSKFGRR